MRSLVEPHLAALTPYVPGKPIEETEREYGIQGIAKLASNENCLGPSPRALEAAARALRDAHLYPDAGGYYLKERICIHHAAHGVTPGHLVLGNGTNELLTLIVRAFVGQGEAAVNGWPSFVVYRIALRGQGREEIAVPLRPDLTYDLDAMAEAFARPAADGPHPKLVCLATPNNPTGRHVTRSALEAFLERIPEDVVVVLDEAYAEYVTADDAPDAMAWAMKRPRTIATRTFSKAYGLASLRVGYAVCDPALADVLNRLRDPFNVSQVAQAAAVAALDDQDHVARSRAHNARELPRMSAALQALGFDVTPSVANFVLVHAPPAFPAVSELNESLLRQGVIVRPVANYGLARSMRITIGTAAENDRLLAAMTHALSPCEPAGVAS